jgi:hypothetical protein
MWNRRLLKPIATVGGVLLVLLLLAATQYGTAPLVGGLPVLAIYLLVIVAARYLLVRRNVYGRLGRKSFDETRTMEFSEAGIHILTEGGAESRLPWGHLASAEIRGPFLLLFTNAIVHLIVPLSAFASEADRESVLEMVRRRELLPPA